jgi:hypothetical protein
VLGKVNKNEIKEFHAINSKVMPMEWLDLIIFANKINPKEMMQKETTFF